MAATPSTDTLLSRGVAEVLPSKAGLAKRMAESPITLYLGIDPTGAFLHLGHMVALRKLQQFALAGHKVILLIGNGTVKIGDPTGRDAARPMLTEAEIEANFQNWKLQAAKVLDFNLIEIKHNGDWLDALKFTDLIKLLAKTTVQQLIERDMFQERIKKGQPIFGHEILYPLLQGYDSVAMNVDLEIGGTDQTFNMLMGRQLQELYNHHEKWVMSTPIINGLDGRKMSKSFNNYVALTEPAVDVYGKLMRLADDQIVEYFNLLTDVSGSEIAEMDAAMKAGANPMEFKKRLAHTITTTLNTTEAADAAAEHFQAAIQNKTAPADLEVISVKTAELSVLEIINQAAPDLSNTEIRRLAEQGSITFFDSTETATKPTDVTQVFSLATPITVKLGKKRWYKITA
jgi:tyrosyl-tRNA synthetase